MNDGRSQTASMGAVRPGARWRRRDTGEHIPWPVLHQRMAGFAKRRGRAWTDKDDELWTSVRSQTWGPMEVGDRQVRIPQWLVDELDGVELAKIGRERIMLSIVWSSYIAGTGGVRLTREEWTETLLCSVRSVSNYLRRLEDRGLIERVQTWQRSPDRPQGSATHTVIVRPGPALLRLAGVTVWESKRPPRRSGHTRAAGKAAARALRLKARQRRRERSGNAYREREAKRSIGSGRQRRPMDRVGRRPDPRAGFGACPEPDPTPKPKAKFANHPTSPMGSLPPAPVGGRLGASPEPRSRVGPPAHPVHGPALPAAPDRALRLPAPIDHRVRPGAAPMGRSAPPPDRTTRPPDKPPKPEPDPVEQARRWIDSRARRHEIQLESAIERARRALGFGD